MEPDTTKKSARCQVTRRYCTHPNPDGGRTPGQLEWHNALVFGLRDLKNVELCHVAGDKMQRATTVFLAAFSGQRCHGTGHRAEQAGFEWRFGSALIILHFTMLL